MPHNVSLISTIAVGLGFALVLGFIAMRLRLPALVGYLLAGVIIGPFTPGFVADADIAAQLAEIGVMLLMFGVGLHFSLDDLLAVVAKQAPLDQPLLLAGFSFGGFVTAGAIARLHTQRPIAGAVLVGTAASRFAVPPVPPELHPQTLVVHGELDETVPLASVMDWARPQSLPVTVVPGGEHFFHGQLPLLKSLVVRHVRA